MNADRTLTLLAAGFFALVAPFAAAQDYPTREIRSLCNYAPGSGADLIVRFYSDRLSKLAGRPVVVENKVGANGMIASDALAKSRPDGYTIMITPASSTIAAAPYLFKTAAGVKATYVPYKQNVQALTDLLLGQLDFIAFDATWAVGQAKGGKLRILAATSAKRSAALPDVPTLAELGYGDTDVSPWWGVVVAAGTPRPVVNRLAGWFNQITAAEDTRQFLANAAFDPFPGTP